MESSRTQIILEVSVLLVHEDFVNWNSLLVARLNFPVVLAQHDRPQGRQRKIEEVTKKRRLFRRKWKKDWWVVLTCACNEQMRAPKTCESVRHRTNDRWIQAMDEIALNSLASQTPRLSLQSQTWFWHFSRLMSETSSSSCCCCDFWILLMQLLIKWGRKGEKQLWMALSSRIA